MGKFGHWCMGPVVPSGYTHQALPGTTIILEATTRGVPLVESGLLEDAEKDLTQTQMELGLSMAQVPKVHAL